MELPRTVVWQQRHAECAVAAVAVLTGLGHAHRVYELAGDAPFNRRELAAEVSRQFGKNIGYHDLAETEYEKILEGFIPTASARAIADAEPRALKANSMTARIRLAA